MSGETTKGLLPYPEAADDNDAPAWFQALATRIDAILGIETLTTVARDALLAAQKWNGRVIFNSTTLHLEVYRSASTSWVAINAQDLVTTQGDTLYASGAGVLARLPKGTGLQYYRQNAGATAPEWASLPAIPTQAVFWTTHTWAIGGLIAVASGQTDFIVPMFVGESANDVVVLDKVVYRINAGTSVTFKMKNGASDITGFTGISCTTTTGTTDPADASVVDENLLYLVVTAVSGSPENMTVTAYLKHTVALS